MPALSPLELLLSMKSTIGPQLAEAGAQVEAFSGKVGLAGNEVAAATTKMGGAFEALGGLAAMGPMAAVIVAMTALGAAVGTVKHAFDNLTSLETASQELENLHARTGTATGDLKGLQLAAEELRIPIDAIPVALKFLQKAIADNKTEFGGFKITAHDTMGALMELADQFAKMPDGPEKTRMALQFLGSRSGTALIPVLNEGSAALKEHIGHWKDLGVILDDTSTNRLAALSRKQIETDLHWQGMWNTISVKLLPVMDKWLDIMMKIADAISGTFTSFTKLANAIDSLPAWAKAMIGAAPGGELGLAIVGSFAQKTSGAHPLEVGGIETDSTLLGAALARQQAAARKIQDAADKAAALASREDIIGGGGSSLGLSQWLGVTNAQDNTGIGLRGEDKQPTLEAMAKIEKWFKDVNVPALKFGDVGQLIIDRLDAMGKIGETGSLAVISGITNAIDGIVTGTETIGQAFDNLITGILQKLAESAAQQGIGLGLEALGVVTGQPWISAIGQGLTSGTKGSAPASTVSININALSAKDRIRSMTSPSGEMNQMQRTLAYASRLP